MTTIALQAGKQDVRPLKENGLRLVIQSSAIVGEFYDVDLDAGEVIVIPGTHDKGTKWRFTLSAEKLAELKEILDSPSFRLLAQENRKRGLDGQSLFLELKWRGEHRWILHWGTMEKVLWEPFELVRNAMRKVPREQRLLRKCRPNTVHGRVGDAFGFQFHKVGKDCLAKGFLGFNFVGPMIAVDRHRIVVLILQKQRGAEVCVDPAVVFDGDRPAFGFKLFQRCNDLASQTASELRLTKE